MDGEICAVGINIVNTCVCVCILTQQSQQDLDPSLEKIRWPGQGTACPFIRCAW